MANITGACHLCSNISTLSGEWGMGNGEWGMGNGEWGIGGACHKAPNIWGAGQFCKNT
ncbi:MAG: hypothetical protein F6K55_11030 [Moorea sp. SIO4A3]|nr:hypothetical protein [Moorena sp. SIO4A3]